jgi:hypothetical protein
MRSMETRRYEMLVRVHEFGEARPERFPADGAGARAFATVAAAVLQLREHAVSEQLAARNGAAAKARAREALSAELDTVSRTARVLSSDTPGVGEAFRRQKDQPDQALLTAGRAFAQQAAAFRSQFVRHGLPDTFIEDLTSRVEAFAQAIRHHEAGRTGQAAARVRIEAALASGCGAVRTLEVIMANQLGADAATIAAWARARRVEYPRRSKRAAPAPVASPPTPDSSRSDATGLVGDVRSTTGA